MASSHLLEDGVSDNLGVPSVSLLSEDAVASESVMGEGWSVKGGVRCSCLPQGYTLNSERAPGNLTPQLAFICYSGEPTNSPVS